MSLAEAVRVVTGEALSRRTAAGLALSADAHQIARACHQMAVRFHRGGKLIVFGNGGASTDANHVSVEFVHPVIVGKRALPTMALTNDPATMSGVANADGFAEVFAHQVRCFADPDDIAMGISADGRCENVRRGLRAASELGLLTIALVGGEAEGAITAEHVLVACSTDPAVVKEIHVTTYHILWELVHVIFEQPGVLSPEVIR